MTRKSMTGLFWMIAAGMALAGTLSPARAETPPAQITACPDSAVRHWDKIIFMITDRHLAATLNVPFRSELDIKVLDDPKTVADLKLKVMDFFRNSLGVNLPDFRKDINIVDVEYAIVGCVVMPAGTSNGQTTCTSTVTSGPGQTTATAICGFTCPSPGTPAISNYVGDGTPFISGAAPNFVCNGSPTLGTSTITCTCN